MTKEDLLKITLDTPLYHITRGEVKIIKIHSDYIEVRLDPSCKSGGIRTQVVFEVNGTCSDRSIEELFTYPVKIVKDDINNLKK